MKNSDSEEDLITDVSESILDSSSFLIVTKK